MIGAKGIAEWLAPVGDACARAGIDNLVHELAAAANAADEQRRLSSWLAATAAEKVWRLPFPMGVFGTLRAGCRNHALMRAQPIAKQQRAFLPQFAAREIGLHFRPGASAPFEIYGYAADAWHALIPAVDELEEFRPGHIDPTVYHRTLAWLYLLPEPFDHPMYDLAMLPHERDLQIDVQGSNYDRLPCWIYSGIEQNRLAATRADSPIIWDGASAH
jgi:hypothetical protein